MRILISATLIILFVCNQSGTSSQTKDTDSIGGVTVAEYKKHYVDSAMKKITDDVLFDTVGVSNAPVKVMSARIVREEYSSYKDISLTYKNVSDKDISAIRFKWYGENSFGEPADMGSYVQEGFGGGYDDDGLRHGRTVTNQWSILSRDAKR